MQRPVLPHKKVFAAVLLVGLVMLFSRRIDAVPGWVWWAGLGLIVATQLVTIYYALRQGCRSFALYSAFLLVVIFGCIAALGYFSRQIDAAAASAPAPASGTGQTETESVAGIIGFGVTVAAFALLVIVNIVRVWLLIRARRDGNAANAAEGQGFGPFMIRNGHFISFALLLVALGGVALSILG